MVLEVLGLTVLCLRVQGERVMYRMQPKRKVTCLVQVPTMCGAVLGELPIQ